MSIFPSAKDEILTVEEVASYLKVSSRLIYGLLSKHEIPAFKVGGTWRFRRDDINEWTKKSEKQSTGNNLAFNASSIDLTTDSELSKIIYQVLNSSTVESETRLDITKSFFNHAKTVEDRAAQGIVETPLRIAKFIVKLAFERWSKANDKGPAAFFDLEWFDPCSGSGVFAEAILEIAFSTRKILTEVELPKITVAEISSVGILATLSMIKHILTMNELSLASYIKSGHLKIKYGDTLALFPEKREIFYEYTNSFDIVVGNPPYVRGMSIDKNRKSKLKNLFPGVYTGDADLYSYFIVGGLLGLKPKGVLSFISPAGFIRSKNSQALRQWLVSNASIDTYYDLDETSPFPDAELHAAIYTIINGVKQQPTINYLQVSSNIALTNLLENNYKDDVAFIEQPKGHGWIFHKSILSKKAFESQFANCKPLQEFGIHIFSGIRPGLSKAYIVDRDRYNTFSKEVQNKWFKPLVLPANIHRWTGVKALHYLLVIPSNTRDIDEEILDHLTPYKNELIQRSEASKNINWFSLRPCTYYDKMLQPKIIFPDLSSQQRFALSDDSAYIPDGAYFIESSDLALLGILNSGLAKNYFINRCSSVGNLNSKGRFRFKKTFVQSFPLPYYYSSRVEEREEIAKVVKQILVSGENSKTVDHLNILVEKFYRETL